jgi:hypothetical protein
VFNLQQKCIVCKVCLFFLYNFNVKHFQFNKYLELSALLFMFKMHTERHLVLHIWCPVLNKSEVCQILVQFPHVRLNEYPFSVLKLLYACTVKLMGLFLYFFFCNCINGASITNEIHIKQWMGLTVQQYYEHHKTNPLCHD